MIWKTFVTNLCLRDRILTPQLVAQILIGLNLYWLQCWHESQRHVLETIHKGHLVPGRDLLPRLGTLCSGPLLRANRTKSKHLLRSSNLFLKVVSQLMTRLSSSSRFSGSWVCLTWWALCFSTVVKGKNTRQLAHLSISTNYLHLD